MKDHETKKDGAQGQPPLKAKTGGEQERQRRHADGHPAARPEVLGDERLSHPANAEPLAELLSQLQHSHGNAYVQRVVGEAGESKEAAESKGLDAGTRSLMESAFGESFGDVRVHTGGAAERMNEELGARAVTHGRDVYFGKGEYDSATREGKELLAHELTHVVQQRGGSSARGSTVGRAGDAHEQEADDIAAAVMRGERVHVERQSAAPAYQRQAARAPRQPPAGAQVVRQFIDAANLAGGTTEGVEYTFTARGPTFIIDFRLPTRGSFVSVTPADRCPRTSGSGSERLTITRRRDESLTIEVTIRSGNKTIVLTIRLPRP
jgi:hypothetical protein